MTIEPRANLLDGTKKGRDRGQCGEFDEHTGRLGPKGIGELGAVGGGSAIAKAIFHATGKRIRELPITPTVVRVSGQAPRRLPALNRIAPGGHS